MHARLDMTLIDSIAKLGLPQPDIAIPKVQTPKPVTKTPKPLPKVCCAAFVVWQHLY